MASRRINFHWIPALASLVFEKPTHALPADTLQLRTFSGRLSQQPDRPTLGARRRLTAGQGHDFGLLVRVVLARRPGAGQIRQGVVQALFQISRTSPPDRAAADAQHLQNVGFGHLLIQCGQKMRPVKFSGRA